MIASYIGEDDASYSFPTEVMAKVTMTVPALAIKPPQGNIRRTQRRQFVRVNTAVDVAIHCPTQSFRPFVTVTVDLSGGGLSIILPKEKNLNEGQSVNVGGVKNGFWNIRIYQFKGKSYSDTYDGWCA